MEYRIYDDQTFKTFYTTDSIEKLCKVVSMLLHESNDLELDHLRVGVVK